MWRNEARHKFIKSVVFIESLKVTLTQPYETQLYFFGLYPDV
jgi:hypothetical protein